MDANGTGQVSLNAWSVSLLVMHTQLEKLVGMTPPELFGMIDTHNSSTISKNEFLAFFQSVQQGMQKAKERQRHSDLKVIEEEETSLLNALGSLGNKLNGNQPKKPSAAPVARHGRPRPKPL